MAKKKPPKKVKVTLKNAPPGSYDIGLDASLRASQRGIKDLIGDIARIPRPGSKSKIPAGTQSLRGWTDVTSARNEDARQRGYLNEDYTTGVGRENQGYADTLADILTNRQTIQRNYGQLANTQRQNFQASGLSEGGAGEQAAGKRATNQAIEMQPLDVAEQRAGVQHQQSLDDLLRQQQRTTADLNTSLGQTNLTYGRGVQDRATQLSRARREASKYKQDVTAAKMAQYTQAGGRTSRTVGLKQYLKWRKLGVV